MKRLEFVEQTLRDGHQTLWANRMRTESMLPIAPTIDRAGFKMTDVASAALFETCVRFLHEDPWERLRLLRQLMPKTELTVLVRGRNLFGWSRYSNDVVELTLKCLKRAGIDRIEPFDTLYDLSNLEWHYRVANEIGLKVAGTIGSIGSPVGTDENLAAQAKVCVGMGADIVYMEDGGLLTPERTCTLIPALREVVGETEIQLHLHCSTGLAIDVCREAIRLGIDGLHTAALPLANGISNVPTIDVLHLAQQMGRDVAVDEQRVREIDDYFFWLAYQEGKPIERPVTYSPVQYEKRAEHQIPGGMVSHLVRQLSELGLEHRLPEIVEEVSKIRRELGYPGMFTPFSQIICVQALVNLLEGQRYRTVSRELALYGRGYYGRPPAPIEPNVLDRLVGDEQSLDPKEMFVEPMVEKFRVEQGPFSSDEDLLLAMFYGRATLEKYYMGKKVVDLHPVVRKPLAALIIELGRRRDIRIASIEKGPLKVAYSPMVSG